jgi:cell division protein ZapA
MKQIEVTIMGQSYILGCPEGGEADLLAAVNSVDREMCAIRDAGRVKARERIAVLASLNLAYALEQRPASAATDAAPDKPASPAEVELGALMQRIDRALGDDGRLL